MRIQRKEAMLLFLDALSAAVCFGSCQMTQCLPDGLVVSSKCREQVEPFSSGQKDLLHLDGNVARCSSTPVLHDLLFFLCHQTVGEFCECRQECLESGDGACSPSNPFGCRCR